MAIAERGEVEVTIGGDVYTMVPTMRIVCEIEKAVGGIAALANKLIEASYTHMEIATVISVALRSKNGPTTEEMYQILLDDGISSYIVPVMDFCRNCLGGLKNLEKAADVDEGKPTGTTE